YDGLDPARRWQFVSTLGNTNFYSAYLAALLPVMLGFFCFAETRLWRLVFGAGLLAGFVGMLPAGSESFMLGLLLALWLLPPLLLAHPQALRRYFAALLLLALALAFMKLLLYCFAATQLVSFFLRLMLHPAVIAALAAIGAAGYLALSRRRAPLRGQRAYWLLSLALLLLLLILLALRNTVFQPLSLGRLDRFIRFDGNWGTDRGRIWRYCLELYEAFPPLQKLFGGGPGCLLAYDMQHPLFPDALLDTAHNEYLQLLLVSGAAGLAGYLGWLSGAAAAALRPAGRSPLALCLTAGALAYAAQAVVSIAQPAATPLAFLLFSMAAGCAAGAPAEDAPLAGRNQPESAL
ncbi:MAG: O-antigen ligase family protein, partial [Clostridia bacterium]|nr:O-antigen ligase family protein [Clostridia bacterium]